MSILSTDKAVRGQAAADFYILNIFSYNLEHWKDFFFYFCFKTKFLKVEVIVGA